jgi:creatinine amidohydrolase
MNLSDLPWPRIQELAPDTPVVIPIAALEQHGHHLPVFTDSLLLGEIIRRVSIRLESKVLFAPLMWLGNSDHHLDFCGTLSAAPRTYLDLLCGLVENFLLHGFRRIVFINGHGGNDVPGKQAIFEVRQKYRNRQDLLLLMGTYWGLGDQPPGGSGSPLFQTEMGHACEWETSMILRLSPQLVGDYQNAPIVPPGDPFRPGNRAWITKDRSTPGHIGWPHLATVDKGELLFDSFSGHVVDWLERVVAWDGKSWDG